jgi:hypothetical protein
VTVRVEAYGGKYGGLLSLTQAGFDKLSFVSGDVIPQGSVMIGERERRIWEAIYAPHIHSDEKDDIRISARFAEYETGDVQLDEDELTVVMLELTPWVTKEGCENRHVVGVREMICCLAMPNIGVWEETGNGEFNDAEDKNYRAPLVADESSIYYNVDDCSYKFELRIIEPNVMIARSPLARDFELEENSAGGAGMDVQIYILPESVSFSGISMEEIPSYSGVHHGYFANVHFVDVWYHTENRGAGKWINVKPDNYWGTDRAWMGARLPVEAPNGKMTYDLCAGTWSDGVLVWHIQWGWAARDAVKGEQPIKTVQTRYDQVFTMDSHGTLSVSKFGNVVSRATNNIIRLNGNVVIGATLTKEEKDEIGEN